MVNPLLGEAGANGDGAAAGLENPFLLEDEEEEEAEEDEANPFLTEETEGSETPV